MIGPDTPLRLSRALEIAFPEGGMTVSGLRLEASRGRLEIERIAGRDFVTLAGIAAMRERCRTPVSPRVPAPARRTEQPQPSGDCSPALAALRAALSVPSGASRRGGRRGASSDG